MRDDIQLMPAKEFFKEIASLDSKRSKIGIAKGVKNDHFRAAKVRVIMKARGVPRELAEAIVEGKGKQG